MKVIDYKGNPQYLSVKLLEDGETEYTIERAEEHKINGEPRLVLLFEGEPRYLRLLAPQVSTLARYYGDETEEWKGKKVKLSRGEKQGIEIDPVLK